MDFSFFYSKNWGSNSFQNYNNFTQMNNFSAYKDWFWLYSLLYLLLTICYKWRSLLAFTHSSGHCWSQVANCPKHDDAKMFSWNPNSFCVQSKGYLCMRTYTLLTNYIKNAEKFGIWQYSEYDCKVNGLVIMKSNIVN